MDESCRFMAQAEHLIPTLVTRVFHILEYAFFRDGSTALIA